MLCASAKVEKLECFMTSFGFNSSLGRVLAQAAPTPPYSFPGFPVPYSVTSIELAISLIFDSTMNISDFALLDTEPSKYDTYP